MVERVAHVGHGQEQHAVRTQPVAEGGKRADRVFAMFEKVVGDDEVEALALDGVEPLAVVENRRFDQIDRRQFWILAAQIVRGKVIDIPYVGRIGDPGRTVQCTDFDPVAAQESVRQIGPRVVDQGSDALQLTNDAVVLVDQRVEPPLKRVALTGHEVSLGVERAALIEDVVVVVGELVDMDIKTVDVGLGVGVTGVQLGETGVEIVALREQLVAVALESVSLAYEAAQTRNTRRHGTAVEAHAPAGLRSSSAAAGAFSGELPRATDVKIPANGTRGAEGACVDVLAVSPRRVFTGILFAMIDGNAPVVRDTAAPEAFSGAFTSMCDVKSPINWRTTTPASHRCDQAATGRRRNRPRISAAAVGMLVPGP